jgi:glutamate synthase domain-containing protein 2
MVPAAKVTAEIAHIRGVPEGQDCVSPPRHTAFSDVTSLVEFCELLAAETGLPVGIKSAVGRMEFWTELAKRMKDTGAGPDFVTIDGGEGGTGAAPLAFTDHVALPFKLGFSRVFATFAKEGLSDRVVFIGSGRLGLPQFALFAMALGCDMVNVGREAMLATGCIQAQRCHTGRCPTGVATQSPWLMRGLDPGVKHARVAGYVRALRGELLALSRSCGHPHPALVGRDQVAIVSEGYTRTTVEEVFGYREAWRRPPAREAEIAALVGSGGSNTAPGPDGGPIPGDGSGAAFE